MARDDVARNPKSVTAQIKLALIASRLHREAEAVKAAHEAHALAPDDLDAKGVLALTRIRIGEYQSGLDLFDKLPARIRDKYGLVKIADGARIAKNAADKIPLLQKSKDVQISSYESIAASLEEGLLADPDNLSIARELGWLYQEKANASIKAYPHLERVVKWHPEDLGAKKLLAVASSNTERFELSIPLYREVLAKDPSDVWMRINLAQTLGWTKQYEEAKRILDSVLKNEPGHLLAKKALEDLAEAQDPSIAIRRRFGDLSPKAMELVIEADREIRKAEKTGDFAGYVKGANMFEEAVVLEPSNLEIRRTLAFLYLDKIRDPKAALQHLKVALAHSPSDMKTRKLLARAYLQTQHFHRSITLTRAILAEIPNDTDMQINLGKTLAEMKNYRDATSEYESVLAREDNFQARFGLAEISAWRGHSALAMSTAEQLLTGKAGDAGVYTLLGDIDRWNYRLGEAEEKYSTALNLDPRNRDAQSGLKEVAKLRSYYLSADYYQFTDSATFARSATTYSLRAPLWEGSFVNFRVADWNFSQGASHVTRLEEIVELECYFTRALATRLKIWNYDYDLFRPEQAVAGSVKWAPTTDRFVSMSFAVNEPAVLDSINIVLNNIRQDAVGVGFDVNIWGRLSTQGTYTLGTYSDGNQRRFASTQLSGTLVRVPLEVSVRCQYDVLSYDVTNPLYFSPSNFQIVRPIIDTTYPVNDWLLLRAAYSLPYVTEQREWGQGITAGTSIKLSDRVDINASYFKHRIPSVSPYSGQGFQVAGFLRF